MERQIRQTQGQDASLRWARNGRDSARSEQQGNDGPRGEQDVTDESKIPRSREPQRPDDEPADDRSQREE